MVAISLGVTVRGSPPRVRSRRRSHRLCERWPGITSACAEQTSTETTVRNQPRDHLRVCGADTDTTRGERERLGSPPRVRSRPIRLASERPADGITSACAEQTA